MRNVFDTNIIFLDCGSGIDEDTYRKMERSGNNVTVIDHHDIDPDTTAKDVYMINPMTGNDYHYLAGCGVVYYTMRQLLENSSDISKFDENALQFAAVGTVADMVSLIGLNRELVLSGFECMNSNINPNLAAILKEMKVKSKRLNEFDVSFYIAPAINSASRFGKVDLAVHALMHGKDIPELIETNNKRKSLTDEAVAQSKTTILSHCVIAETENEEYSFVLGLIGNRVMPKYQKPFASVMRRKGDCSVSFRMPQEGFDLHPFFVENKDIFESGGHSAAGGGTCKEKNLDILLDNFVKYCEQNFTPKVLFEGDIYLPEKCIIDVTNEMPSHSPFGMGFKNPLFMSDVLLKTTFRSEKYLSGKFVWADLYNTQHEVDMFSFKPGQIDDGYVQCIYMMNFDQNNVRMQIVETAKYE
jgi:single-stranded-DNA-specific exonuclease